MAPRQKGKKRLIALIKFVIIVLQHVSSGKLRHKKSDIQKYNQPHGFQFLQAGTSGILGIASEKCNQFKPRLSL